MRRLFLFLGAASVLALAGQVLQTRTGPTAQAQTADLMDAPAAHYATVRTLTLGTDIGTLRIDTDRRAISMEIEGRDVVTPINNGAGSHRYPGLDGRVTWEGGRLWFAQRGREPVQLPTMFADRVGEAYDAILAGFAGMTFVEQHPGELWPQFEATRGRSLTPGRWRRVQTPWTWDDAHAIYLYVGHGAYGSQLHGLTVLDLSGLTPQPVSLLPAKRSYDFGFVGIGFELTDVPLDPDIEDPTCPDDLREHWPGWGTNPLHPLYHESLRTVLLELDPTSTDPPRLDDACENAGVTELPITATWTVPQDADTLSRLAAARAACDEVTFSMGMRAILRAPEVGQACYEGTWRVVDGSTTPPTVLWSKEMGTCVANGRKTDPFVREAAVPMSASAADLRVQFQGTARMTCQAVSSTVSPGDVRFVFEERKGHGHRIRDYKPRMTWDCYPGW